MIDVYFLIGLPGSSKSTWARKKAVGDPKTVILNRDSIRTMLKNEYTYNHILEPLVKAILFSAIRDALSLGFNLIIDETHITKGKRKETYDRVTLFGYDINIVYVHFTETERNLEYRMQDARGVSKEVWQTIINGMKKDFEPFDGEDYDLLIEVAMK